MNVPTILLRLFARIKLADSLKGGFDLAQSREGEMSRLVRVPQRAEMDYGIEGLEHVLGPSSSGWRHLS